MSLVVILYQLGIFASIFAASHFFGVKGLVAAVAGASVWTLTHVFAPWLMALQFGTILLAVFFSSAVMMLEAGEKYAKERYRQGSRWHPLVVLLRFFQGTSEKVRGRLLLAVIVSFLSWPIWFAVLFYQDRIVFRDIFIFMSKPLFK